MDLCALIKYKTEGIYAIQALGQRFGDYDRHPYVFLDGDDRAGTISQGENLFINGDKWDKRSNVLSCLPPFMTVLLLGRIQMPVINMVIPNQPEIEVRLSDSSNHRICAIIELTNQGGSIRANREVRYFNDIGDMDRHYKFGFRIVNGSKD